MQYYHNDAASYRAVFCLWSEYGRGSRTQSGTGTDRFCYYRKSAGVEVVVYDLSAGVDRVWDAGRGRKCYADGESVATVENSGFLGKMKLECFWI